MSERDARLVSAGVDLFVSLLTADKDIQHKVNADDKLEIVLIYDTDLASAEAAKSLLSKTLSIKNKKIIVKLSDGTDLDKYLKAPPAGILLTERNSISVDDVALFSQKTKRLTFSPFSEDLIYNIHGSIYISDRILPWINISALNRSSIHIKPFYLKISKHYE